MNLLGLDLGTNVGAAWFSDRHHTVTWHLLDDAERRWCSPALRFIRFREKLQQMVGAHHFDLVVYEKVMRHSSTYASHIYGGLHATLLTTLEDLGVPFEGVGIGEAKQALTGRGNASKQAMLDAAAALGVSCEDDNSADALGILLAGEDKHGIVRLSEAARSGALQGPPKRRVRSAGRQRNRNW